MVATRQASAPVAPTPQMIASWDVAQRRAYYNSLPANQRGAAMQSYANYRDRMNRAYMQNTFPLLSVCPPQSGNALSQTYAVGDQLTYNVKTAQNAFLEGFIVRVSVNLNLATGTGATYALTDAGALALIQEIDLLYGNTQLRMRPYSLQYYPTITKWLGALDPFYSVPSGFHSDTTLQAYMKSTFPVSTGNQTYTYEYFVRLNMFSPVDPRGLLPIMSGETTAQININTCPTLMGGDPINNVLYDAGGGSGNAVTLQATPGTIQVIAVYRDGTTGDGSTKMALDLAGLPTIQWDIDPPLNNLQSGDIFLQKINKAEGLIFCLLSVVDGVDPGKFAAYSNIDVIELAKDSAGTNLFWKYGQGTNIDVLEYFAQLRRQFGQDLITEGVIPIVYAPSKAIADPSNLTGSAVLNTRTSGWTDVNYGIQVAAIGNNANPRVENHLIFINNTGLIAG